MERDRNRNRNQNNARNRSNGRNKTRNENKKTNQNHKNSNNGEPKKNASNGVKKRQIEAINPIGYRTLETVLQIENDAEFILKLSSRMNGFLILLNEQSIRPDLMRLILSALAKASKCSTELSTVQLLVHFYMEIIPKLSKESNFCRELKLFVVDLMSAFESFAIHRQIHVNAVENLLTFLRRMQLTIYQKSFDAVRDLMQLITAQIEFVNRKGNKLNDYITETMDQLNESIINYDQMKMDTEQTEVLLEPPDDFRRISIYPNTFDILSNHSPFIRKNVINGKYVGGIDHYLDIQFRLLREDFVRSLREGITAYRDIKSKIDQKQQENLPKFRINDLNIYKDVHILGSKMLHNEQVHSCKFNCTPFRKLRWQFNKRMMNGSLVCLSSDDFESFFFATVAGQRQPDKLAKGEFEIKLEVENAAMIEITPLITYVMVESHVYFEAYRHNLKVMQDFNKDNFPLERYIVNVDKNILSPSYLTEASTFKISNGLPKKHPDAKLLSVKMLGDQQWPPRDDFRLDESQYAAFRAALTKQMVIIQGPPGTGKTYIGLRIVKVLLENTKEFPILIVCYTNHALDQFLEGILKFCKTDLVRIGGKSQCEALEKYNLSRIKSDMSAKRQVPAFIHKRRIESNIRLKQIQEDITQLESNIEQSTSTVLGYQLQNVIKKLNPMHLVQLNHLSNGRLDLAILDWLGYVVKIHENQENNGADDNINMDIEMVQEALEDLEMDEEYVREMEEQRIIDDSSDEDMNIEENIVDNHGPVPFHETINLNNVMLRDELDDDGFQKVKNNRKSVKNQFKREIKKTTIMSQEQAKAIPNIHALLPEYRWNLYRLWIKMYVEIFEDKIKLNRELYRNECLLFNGLRKQEDIEIVKKAKIIGMTTTGAAKYRHIIDGTMPKITVVEEAAEVLEAHIVTALCKNTDHLILIGDHLQLRPNPAIFELAKNFNLEFSLFERLIKNNLEYYQLKQQHRMRPCISSLLVPHIYKQLLDHPSVQQYEDVKGISKNMYFLNHSHNEVAMEETRSHLNIYEAEFIVQLCRYIILQGYDKSQVTILTTYSGQLHQIRQLMRSQQLLDGVRATVVDNYQGEECDIILLSFVRSNDVGNIGFLKIANRVNVALSRAKKGLYCIGNFDCLAENSDLWKKLMSDLTRQQAIGNALEIYCQNHTDYKTLVNSKNDFDVAPEGGCRRPCDARLPCGHSCTRVCHIVDREHTDLYKNCYKPCDKIICEREHRCPKMCHFDKDCNQCKTMIDKLRIECQHMVRVYCSGDPSLVFCTSPCNKLRSCNHKCKRKCGEICEEAKCFEEVQAISSCGHKVTVKCSDATNNLKLLEACTEKCNKELECGHLCKGSCGKCKKGRLHISCYEKCTRMLICGHPCTGKCSVDCAPCKKKCTNSCVHSKCSLRCGEPCPPCMEKCSWSCEHLKCSKLCSEPCDRELCKHASTKLIEKCGHPSIGVCGEKTPKLCRICDKDTVQEIFFGSEDDEDARFIELDDCNHIVEVDALIYWMNDNANSDPNSNSIQFKNCPKCKTVIRTTKSLNTFIQASIKDIQQVKLLTCGNPEENRTKQLLLHNQVKKILNENETFNKDPLKLRNIYKEIFCKTEPRRKKPPNQKLVELNNQFELVKKLKEIWSAFDKRDKKNKNLSIDVIDTFEQRLQMAASFIADYTNCNQQRSDISVEISFLDLMCNVIIKASKPPFNDTGKKLLNDAFTVADKYGSAIDDVRNEFKRIINEAYKHASGIGISFEEKEMILKAVDLGKGHWFKCKNGHVYAIGECGGANQRGKCPECGSAIGGENYHLDRSNALATEMDGSTRWAYPGGLY